MRLFVDWDGTITVRDSLVMVIHEFGDPRLLAELEPRVGVDLTLHEEIALEFAAVTAPLDEVVAWVLEHVEVRPGLAELAEFDPVVVSAGFRELIEPVLAREGVELEVLANTVEARPGGWVVRFRDEAVCATCGEPCKRSGLAGEPYVYVGDGYSDRCAALAAERVFARDSLAAFLQRPWIPVRAVSGFHRSSGPPLAGSSGALYPRRVSRILLESVTKEFSGGVIAVDNVDLTIESGEFMVLVGPSGCGKSTLLRMIAGLEEVTDGTIMIGDRDVTELAPRARDIAMVFQNYALYPHMSVRKNLGYGLKVRKTPAAEVDRRVAEAARLLGLEDLLDRRPAALSGGQRQRVAMGRAIVREPAAFLMDEPLSNLDAKLRVGMRAELTRLHDRLGVTTVYVTHDQIEAMTLGQRVAVMRDGVIQQVDRPQVLYRQPINLFVAAFIGSPSMNLVEGQVASGVAEFAGWRIPLDDKRRPAREGRAIIGIRPEDFEDAAFAESGHVEVEVEVSVVEELGAEAHVIFPVEAAPVEAEDLRAAHDEYEADAKLLADDPRAHFTARVDPRTSARQGATLRLAVNSAAFHFFDAETGVSLAASTEERELQTA